MNSVFLITADQHAAQASALCKRIYPSKLISLGGFLVLISRLSRYLLVLKKIERSVINIGRSMFDVQSVLCHLSSIISPTPLLLYTSARSRISRRLSNASATV